MCKYYLKGELRRIQVPHTSSKEAGGQHRVQGGSQPAAGCRACKVSSVVLELLQATKNTSAADQDTVVHFQGKPNIMCFRRRAHIQEAPEAQAALAWIERLSTDLTAQASTGYNIATE